MKLTAHETAAIAQLDRLTAIATSFLDDYDYLVTELTPPERRPDEPCYCPYYQLGINEFDILCRLLGDPRDEVLDWFTDRNNA